jgi:Icc-related predicted phosphoesterase
MIIDCISDLHGFYPDMPGGDLLIIAGDLTRSNRVSNYQDFFNWLRPLKYRKKIIVGGNHDVLLDDGLPLGLCYDLEKYEYLLDSGCEFEGFKIWGSPWTKTFEGMNKHCMAFTQSTEQELAEKFSWIPADTDILVTHSPPHGILDKTSWFESVGSIALLRRINEIRPSLSVFGHVHEGYGLLVNQDKDGKVWRCANASYLNEKYKPVNVPIRVKIETKRQVEFRSPMLRRSQEDPQDNNR